ncbi:hypothetical protein NF212_15650 [Parasalinivibrio latis]|uniref:hypothetical protein n=1 Tax=Parasalinivibrio latis TaxID=2952610 RepID=UPI0030E3DE70
MLPFQIGRLETEVGIVRLEGNYDPVSGDIQVDHLDLMATDGWQDVSHWLSEQAFEAQVQTIFSAARSSLSQG